MQIIPRARRRMERRQRPFFEDLPSAKLEWPRVDPRPAAPSPPTFLHYIPFLFSPLIGIILGFAFQKNFSWQQALLYGSSGLVLGLSYPAIMLWDHRRKTKAYEESIQQRLQSFRMQLDQINQQAQRLAKKQREILKQRYPEGRKTVAIALNPQNWRKRLWMREEHEEDFLRLRVGTGNGPPSFQFADPPTFQKEDRDLEVEIAQVLQRWSVLKNIPVVLDLKTSRNVLLRGERAALRPLAYRLLLDVVVHHSPRKVNVGLIADKHSRVMRAWGWMYWLPHTYALEIPSKSLLAFGPDAAYRLVDFLKQKVEQTLEASEHRPDFRPREYTIVFFDDTHIRTIPDVAFLVEEGYKAGVYLIFLGDETTPSYPPFAEIRFRKDGMFQLRVQKTGGDEASSKTTRTLTYKGVPEQIGRETMEKVARMLAGIMPPEPLQEVSDLPKILPLVDFLANVYASLREDNPLFPKDDKDSVEDDVSNILAPMLIEEMWRRLQEALRQPDNSSLHDEAIRQLVSFPTGLTIRQGKLKPVYLNLLPEGSRWGGFAAYHTILIGPTGSGKSEFIKSLIWGGAYRYPPTVFNVYFIDFKGGAALEDLTYRWTDDNGQEHEMLLPHIVGLVTNPDMAGEADLLGRAVSLRGIDALQREMDRRMRIITKEGKSNDIWEYNRKYPDQALPHLLIILDEFSKALQDFPELNQLLDNLVRLGRSLGMYLLLANQNVTQEVTRLLANVGWRIALRMSGSELREVLGEPLSDISQVGRGYLMCVPTGEIQMFQSPYGGLPLYEEREERQEYAIYSLVPSGRNGVLSTIVLGDEDAQDESRPHRSQGRALTEVLCQIAQKHEQMWQSRAVYLEPLPARIPLNSVLERDGGPWAFWEDQWILQPDRLLHEKAPFGLMDNLETVQYEVVRWALDEEDGHLWIMGVAASGREQVVASILAALAHRYTPEELHIYILDFGAGSLKEAEGLPHLGGYIDASHEEKRYRLFHLLQTAYATRKEEGAEGQPRLLLVLFDFHIRDAMDKLEDDEINLLYRLIQEGRSLNIHLILVTTGVGALRDDWAGGLGRRFILQLGRQEEYWDAGLPRHGVLPFTRQSPGRGYWVVGRSDSREIREAQAAQVEWAAFRDAMRQGWAGALPQPVEILPPCLPLQEWEARMPAKPAAPDVFPIGLDFETLAPVNVHLYQEPPTWLISGPAKKGKTAFLFLWAHVALQHTLSNQRKAWEVCYFGTQALPKQALQLAQYSNMHLFVGKDELSRGWEKVQAILASLRQKTPTGQRLLLLLDDIPESLQEIPEDVLLELHEALRANLLHVVTATRKASDALRGLNYDVEKGRLLNMSRDEGIGIAFAPDELLEFYHHVNRRDLKTTWLQAWKRASSGRAFFLYRGKIRLIQTPYWLSCEEAS